MLRKIKRVGGSLVIFLPRDIAEIIGLREGGEVSMTIFGSRLVVGPPGGDDELRNVVEAALHVSHTSEEK